MSHHKTDEIWVNEVLHFWFDELSEKEWFSFSQEVDDLIKSRFQSLLEGFGETIPNIAFTSARGALAVILLYDQMTRNIYRGSPLAFSYDERALEILDNALKQGFDKVLADRMRRFLYMPLMHSEDKKRQDQALTYFATFNDDMLFGFAKSHAEIIYKFGRYPHRNAVLGRKSTLEEEEYLKTAERFGQ